MRKKTIFLVLGLYITVNIFLLTANNLLGFALDSPLSFSYVAGVILSVGIATIITVLLLRYSNDAGSEKMKLEDYTDEPIDFYTTTEESKKQNPSSNTQKK